MAFKLKFQGKGKNPYGNIVRKGLVTPAHLIDGVDGEDKKIPKGNQSDADKQAAEKAKSNMKVVSTETRKVEGGTELIENLEGEGKGKTYKEAGVDPAAAQAYWKANPKKYQEYLASKKLKDQRITFIPDEGGDGGSGTPDPVGKESKFQAEPQQMGLYDFLRTRTFDVPLDLNKTVVKEQQSYRGGPIREYYTKERMTDAEIKKYLEGLGPEGGKILAQYGKVSKENPGDGTYNQYSSTGDNQRIKNLVEDRNQPKTN